MSGLRKASAAVLGFALFAAAGAASATTITITNADGSNEGFNDTTPFTPVGGNNAATLGEARLNVFRKAADSWAAKVNSAQTIMVSATFDPLTCSATSATIGAARVGGFAQRADVGDGASFYPFALFAALSNSDPDPSGPDIVAQFNSDIDNGCLSGTRFYYGFDHNTGGSSIDLFTTVQHELAHGLGFVSFVNVNDGTSPSSSGRLSIFDKFVYDEATGRVWTGDSAAQRQAAIVSGNGLSWNGSRTNMAANGFLTDGRNTAGRTLLYAPNPVSPGSSVSHFDSSATPNLLMEAFIRTGIKTLDLTPCAMADLGWTLLTSNCLDAGNSAPLATAQTVSATVGQAKAITLIASDPDGDTLTYTIVTQPTRGSLTGSGANQSYTASSAGSDSFTFRATDPSGASSTATVTINVAAAPNRAPTANAQSVNAVVGNPITITLTATDPDGDTLTYSIVSQPARGTLSGSGANQTYTASSAGSDSFTFRATDPSGASSTAIVTIAVMSWTPLPTTTADSGGGGGGAIGSSLLLGLASLLGLRRRKRG